MSNYERNTTMIFCILGVLVVGSIAVGAITFYGSSWLGHDNTPVYFHEDSTIGSVSGLVTINADINTGSLNILFVDNDTLLYDVDVQMSNRSYLQYGDPTIAFSSNTLTLSHEVAAFNITLGNGINYTINAQTSTGSIACVLSHDALVGDVALTTGTGSIAFTMTNDVTLIGNVDFDLTTNTGSVTAVIILPDDVGADFSAELGVGSIVVNAPTWDKVTSTHYQSDDYGDAPQNLDIVVETSVGSVTATLS